MDEFQLPSVVGKITRMFVCLNESREQKKAIFLFQALHAVVYVLCCGVFFFFFFCQFRVVFFLNYSGIVTNQMYSVSLLLAISDFHTWISGNGENTEPMKFWTCFNILKMHCHSHILLKEEKKRSSVPPVPGRVETLDVAVGRRTAEKCCSRCRLAVTSNSHLLL